MTPEMKQLVKQTVIQTPHFEQDCTYFFNQLHETFDWFKAIDIIRQVALIALCFVIGWKNVLALSNVIFYLANNNFLLASQELLKEGHESIAKIIDSGKIPS